VRKIREDERVNLFGNVASEAIRAETTRDMGGQFLTNKERIGQSKLYEIAKEMPKGMHLHIHFNAELQPDILIDKSRENPCMFIRSTQPLLQDKDYDETEMVFSVLPSSTRTVDIFSSNYNPEFRAPGSTPWMRWSTFREEFDKRRREKTEDWIKTKLILSEHEVYDSKQTTNG
jgi:adenosine deaminase CECR1